eukprot:CAMPEP_0183336638 /NCGR_PEP_ID=MMETSP0164_2-20130417/4562_1 /TAXON_ID=221442 /ORGANISM="Coccolithus pelagicus ssp braarudi, Strain PLY182g" /LENGTH=107 /DNA_ID=CAMNT_0025506205 /DNA_START=383 /DNA_END=704 /DNA_ORIENTATION=+
MRGKWRAVDGPNEAQGDGGCNALSGDGVLGHARAAGGVATGGAESLSTSTEEGNDLQSHRPRQRGGVGGTSMDQTKHREAIDSMRYQKTAGSGTSGQPKAMKRVLQH